MLGITRAITSISRPSMPSHELDGETSDVSAKSEVCEGVLVVVVLVAMLRRELRPLEVVDHFWLEAASMAISAQEYHPIAPHIRCSGDLRKLLLVCIVKVKKRFC